MSHTCAKCSSLSIVKNGHTYHKKQRLKCKECGYQFTEYSTKIYIGETIREQVRKLLLERIPLAGIIRVLGVSKTWLSKFRLSEYAALPDNLNADIRMPTEEVYKSDNLDNIICSLPEWLRESALPTPLEQADWAEIIEDAPPLYTDINPLESIYCEPELTNPDFIEQVATQSLKDPVFKKLYETKLVHIIAKFVCEADEVWSFVGKKSNKQWIWLVQNKANKQIIGYFVGDHSTESAQKLWESIPLVFREKAFFCTDFWDAYNAVIPEDQHHAGGKDIGFVNHLERFNCTLRQRCSRLVRKSLSFSKSLTHHIGAIKYFICHYNKTCFIT